MSRTIKKQKTGGKSVSPSCGNNKGCPVCFGNRMHKHNKKWSKEDGFSNTIDSAIRRT